ncbi:MAG: 3-oxoacyl-ACP reductase FabG [Gammaproteobacteria bacterium]|nr:3-oxoacyl-ACP reductase FabG [Gammaproteobacteria bacterium]
MSSDGKRALVTGGSGEIGGAICRRLAAAGHRVYVHANSQAEHAKRLCDELVAAGAWAQAISFDVTNEAETRRQLDLILEDGPIQILVNNAGVHDDAVFPGMEKRQWQRVIDVSVEGFFNVTKPLTLPMIRTRWGRIVSISSVSSIMGNRGQVNYAAAKGAINAATRSLSLELASRGITVNAVAPGIIDTAVTNQVFDAQSIARLVPVGRAGRPDEVADLVGYLVSDAGAYITGQVISINGGMI